MMKEEREPLDTAYFRTVMETFSEDMKTLARDVAALKTELKKRSDGTGPTGKNDDMGRLEIQLQKMGSKLSELGQPRHTRILLFPEQDRKLFYRIVFGRWLLYLCIACTMRWLFGLACLMENNRHLERRAQDDVRIRAWQQLYDSSNRKDRKKMEKIYGDVVRGGQK